jgi:hypothetical protein
MSVRIRLCLLALACLTLLAVLVGCGSSEELSGRERCASMTIKSEHDACLAGLLNHGASERCSETGLSAAEYGECVHIELAHQRGEEVEEGADEEASEEVGDDTQAAEEELETPEERVIAFHALTRNGWEYEGVVPYPEPEASFKKNISSSPPGAAKVEASFWADIPEVRLEYPDTNPGRPDGPLLEVAPGRFKYQLPRSAEDLGLFQFGPCELSEVTEFNGFEEEPVATVAECDPASEAPEGLSDNGPEAKVEKLIHVLNNEQPSYVLTFEVLRKDGFYGPFLRCEVSINPDGSIERPKEAEEPNCGARNLRLKVE